MTVENVLERTVVRAAAPGGGAESAGVETGSLLVALDGQSTKVLHDTMLYRERGRQTETESEKERPLQLFMVGGRLSQEHVIHRRGRVLA